MIFEQVFTDAVHRTYSYVLGDEDTKLAVVFDPAFGHEELAAVLDKHDLKVEYIIHTHGHYDHTGGTDDFQKKFGGRVVAHHSQKPEIPVRHGDTLELGGLSLEFLETPGHTQDGICILCEKKLVTGDTLFVGKIGGTSTIDQAKAEFRSLHDVLLKLDDEIEVYSGHNYGVAPTSTIGNERRTNPFLLQPDFDAFLHLKEHWAEYKAEHGIQ